MSNEKSGKTKVVIIDDEEGVLEMYKAKLETEGFQVLTALDGPAGIEIIKKENPAVILLDIIMPKLNGFDVLNILKSNQATANIPVILLTNLPKEAGEQKGHELKAAGYLVKAEYEPRMLADMIRNLIETMSKWKEVKQKWQEAGKPPTPPMKK